MLEWTTGHLNRHGSETPRLDAELLLAHARECQRIQLYTEYNDALTPEQRNTMRELVRRRAAAEPVAYLTGHREFFSIDLDVTPDVFIPRPETETLLIEALDIARRMDNPRVLDVGTGSGCLAISLAANLPSGPIVATESSEAAIVVAARNAARADVTQRIDFRPGDATRCAVARTSCGTRLRTGRAGYAAVADQYR